MESDTQETRATSPDTITLWPHRSLSKRGFRLLMIALGGLMALIGTLFFVLGAWPVIGFLGLEILVVWMAFRMNYNAARRRETLAASRDKFRIERTAPNGTTEIEELPTPWLKARLEETADSGESRPGRLVVSAHGKEAEIGAFLHDAEKQELLPEINAMLDKAQR